MKDPATNARLADRLPTKCQAYIREGRGLDRPAILTDVSVTGCRCYCAYRFDEAGLISLVIPGVDVFRVTVHWKSGWTMGVSFHQELSWRQLKEIRAAAREHS